MRAKITFFLPQLHGTQCLSIKHIKPKQSIYRTFTKNKKHDKKAFGSELLDRELAAEREQNEFHSSVGYWLQITQLLKLNLA
jgi:hypothetical protein